MKLKRYFFIMVAILVVVIVIMYFYRNNSTIEDWVGNYRFEEGDTGMSWEYNLSIKKENNKVIAYIYLDGYMKMIRIKAETVGNSNNINLIFDDYLTDNIGKLHGVSKGDCLLTMKRNNDIIYTYWGVLEPELDDNRKNGEIYFAQTD